MIDEELLDELKDLAESHGERGDTAPSGTARVLWSAVAEIERLRAELRSVPNYVDNQKLRAENKRLRGDVIIARQMAGFKEIKVHE